MTRAIRKHAGDFVALIVLFVIAIGISGFIIYNQDVAGVAAGLLLHVLSADRQPERCRRGRGDGSARYIQCVARTGVFILVRLWLMT